MLDIKFDTASSLVKCSTVLVLMSDREYILFNRQIIVLGQFFLPLMILNCPVLFFLEFFHRVGQNPRNASRFFFSLHSKIRRSQRRSGMEGGLRNKGREKKVQDEVIYNARHPHGFHGEAMYGRVTSTSLLHSPACAFVRACARVGAGYTA